jgi:hypothetical protein
MPETNISESIVSTSGPLPQVNVAIGLPLQEDCSQVACPPGLTFKQKQRLLRAAKKQINAELYEMHKTLMLIEHVWRM